MRVPVTDLVGRPGATRRFDDSVTQEEVGDEPWGPAADALEGPIRVSLQLDSVVEGIFAHGSVAFRTVLPCARCLEPVRVDHDVAVSELFQDPRKLDEGEEAEEGYELVDELTAIDLEQFLHDVVLLDLPVRVRCERPECVPASIDAVELQTEEQHLQARAERPDPRWAKLAELELPADET